MDIRHKKKHDLDDTNDHVGIPSAVVDEIMKFDANGLPAISKLKHYHITRDVPITGFDYVEIGKFTQAQGSFTLMISVASEHTTPSASGADLYYIVAKYDETAAAWELAYPLQTVEGHSQLCVMIDDDELHLRLIAINSSIIGVTPVDIQIMDMGIGNAVFTPATGTGSMGLPAQEFASTLISQVAGKVQTHAEMGMNSEKITSMADGSASTQDGCTVNQMEAHVLAAIGDNVSKSPPMIAATTAALPANTRTADVLLADANGEFPTIDGVPPVVNQDYLVKNEGGGPSHINNGIYTLTIKGTAGTKWELTRRHDMEGGEGASGAMCPIASGTGAGDTTFKCINNIGSDVVNTDALEFWYWGQTTDHANLKNLNWDVAGHVINADIDMNSNGLTELGKLVATAGADLTIKLGDNAGAKKLTITDSDDAEIFSLDSNGNVVGYGSVSPAVTSAQDMGDATHVWKDIHTERILFYDDSGAENASITRSLTTFLLDSGTGGTTFRLDVAGAEKISMTGSASYFTNANMYFTGLVKPNVTSAYDLGGASNVWQNVYCESVLIYDTTGAENGAITRTTTSLKINNGAGAQLLELQHNSGTKLTIRSTGVEISANSLLPNADSARNIGSSALRFADIYNDASYVETINLTDSTHAEFATFTRSLTQLIIDSNDATIEIQVDSIKALTIDATNSISVFKTDGSSRYWHEYLISAFSTDPGVTGATLTPPSANTLGGYQLDADTELLYFNSHVEDDWDGATDIIVEVFFEINAAGGGGGDTVDLKLICYYKGDAETANKTQTLEEATIVGTAAQFTQFKATFTIDHDLGGNVVDVNDTFGFILNLETDTSEVDDIIINLIEVKYKTTKPQLEVA